MERKLDNINLCLREISSKLEKLLRGTTNQPEHETEDLLTGRTFPSPPVLTESSPPLSEIDSFSRAYRAAFGANGVRLLSTQPESTSPSQNPRHSESSLHFERLVPLQVESISLDQNPEQPESSQNNVCCACTNFVRYTKARRCEVCKLLAHKGCSNVTATGFRCNKHF